MNYFRRAWWSVCRLFVALLMLSAPAFAATGEQEASKLLADAQHRIEAGSDAAPMICLAATALVPTHRDSALMATRAAADEMLAEFAKAPAGRAGLGLRARTKAAPCDGPGTTMAFHDGRCNVAETRYAYETAHGLECLARASLVTGGMRYAKAAEAVMRYWSGVGAEPPRCKGCFYFWYDDAPYHAGRYVRNINVLMGTAAAWLWKATGSEKDRQLALGVAKSEAFEAAHGNHGYMGVLDPKFKANPDKEAWTIENHSPLVAGGLLEIGWLLKQPEITKLGFDVYRTWLTCDGRSSCKIKPCSAWAAPLIGCTTSQVMTPCLFRDLDSGADALCLKQEAVLDHLDTFQIDDLYEDDLLKLITNETPAAQLQ